VVVAQFELEPLEQQLSGQFVEGEAVVESALLEVGGGLLQQPLALVQLALLLQQCLQSVFH